jgi:hypothetical protein
LDGGAGAGCGFVCWDESAKVRQEGLPFGLLNPTVVGGSLHARAVISKSFLVRFFKKELLP